MSRGNLIDLLLTSQKAPFVVGISHSFTSSPNYFQYRFTKSSSNSSSSSSNANANLPFLGLKTQISDTGESMNIKMQVQIEQIMQVGKQMKVVEQVTHEFLVFCVSKRSVILFSDHGIGQSPTCLSLKYSKLSKTWTAVGSYHQISSLFTINSTSAGGYGLLSELFCKDMRICFNEPSATNSNDDDDDDDDYKVGGTLNISCYGPCNILLNSSVVVDRSDFTPPQKSKRKTENSHYDQDEYSTMVSSRFKVDEKNCEK